MGHPRPMRFTKKPTITTGLRGVPPQRPGEGPEEELESDPVGVLDDEDQEDPDAGQRSDRPATQFAPVRLLPVWLLPTRLNCHHVLLLPVAVAASAHVDVGDLDGVVAVAETVPGWNLGLHVPGGVGRAGAEAVAAALGRLPCE